VAERLSESGPVLPWANLTAATSESKRTGITGSLLAEGDPTAPAVGSVAARAKPTASSQKRTRSSGGTGSLSGASGARPRVTRARTTAPPANAPSAAQLTAGGLAALERELAELTTVRRPEVILRVKHARELGDLRENADYEAARREQSFLEGRIREVEQTLRNAVVITTQDSGVVHLGSTVEVDVEGERSTLHLVGPSEADPFQGRISDASPVGKALLGRRAGDEVVIQTPGRQVRYRVLEVSAG
jgi:transcription elongation factor GreA